MQTVTLKKAVLMVSLLSVLGPGLMAQPTPAGRGGFGYMARLEKAVGLTPEQRDAVRGLMADQRQKSQAVREETDTKIRSLLNAEQQKKYDAFRAENKAKQNRSKS